MAVKTLNTRLQLKYDTHANWELNNPTLMAGEIAIATVPAATGDVKQAPAVLIKVGDGTTPYKGLQFASGMAANVHGWALAAEKPEYTADDIVGLDEFINTEIQDTNTTYQVVKVDEYNYKLQSKELDGEWTDVANSTIVIPKYDDTEVKADIAALEGLVGGTAVATQIANAIAALKLDETYDAKGAASDALAAAKTYTNELANGAVKTNTDAIAAIKDGATLDSFKDVEDALAANKTASDEADATNLQAAKDYADEKAEALQSQVDDNKAATEAAQDAADKAQGDVDTLAGKVGTVPEDKTVVQMIADAQTAATYDDTQVKADIKANADAIDAIEADYLKAADKTELVNATALKADQTALEAEIARAKAAEKVNADAIELLTNGVDTETVDGVNDLIQYVKDHGTEVTGMQEDIAANTKAIGDEETRAKGVEEGLNTRLTTAEGEIDALQADTHTHANKALLDTYTQTEADLADAVAKKHAHANATVLDGITAEKVAAWDAAEGNAKAYTDELANGAVKDNTDAIAGVVADYLKATDKTELEGKITTAQNAADAAQADVDALEPRVQAIEANAVFESDTLILNCGTSVIA